MLEAEPVGKKLGHLRGDHALRAAVKDVRVARSEFSDHLTARSTRGAVRSVDIVDGYSENTDDASGSFGNGAKDGRPLCAIGKSIRDVFDVAAGEDASVVEQDGCPHSKLGIGRIGVMHGLTRRFDEGFALKRGYGLHFEPESKIFLT